MGSRLFRRRLTPRMPVQKSTASTWDPQMIPTRFPLCRASLAARITSRRQRMYMSWPICSRALRVASLHLLLLEPLRLRWTIPWFSWVQTLLTLRLVLWWPRTDSLGICLKASQQSLPMAKSSTRSPIKLLWIRRRTAFPLELRTLRAKTSPSHIKWTGQIKRS